MDPKGWFIDTSYQVAPLHARVWYIAHTLHGTASPDCRPRQAPPIPSPPAVKRGSPDWQSQRLGRVAPVRDQLPMGPTGGELAFQRRPYPETEWCKVDEIRDSGVCILPGFNSWGKSKHIYKPINPTFFTSRRTWAHLTLRRHVSARSLRSLPKSVGPTPPSMPSQAACFASLGSRRSRTERSRFVRRSLRVLRPNQYPLRRCRVPDP